MDAELNLTRMCRHCGALLNDAGGECWFCHRTLAYDDIVRVERRPPQRESRVPTEEARKSVVNAGEREFETGSYRSSGPGMPWGAIYQVGGWIAGVIVFFTGWIYAIVTYGIFLGLGLGWIPSLIIAAIAGLLWPLIVAVLALIVAVVIYPVGQ